MATVASVLFESTTMISSAQETDSRAAPMLAASLWVMTVTVSFTHKEYRRRACLPDRNQLHGLEVDQRPAVGNDRVQLRQTGGREVALGLNRAERIGQADGQALFLRLQPLFGQFPGLLGGRDPLKRRV